MSRADAAHSDDSGGYLDLLRREGDFRRVYLAGLVSLAGDWFAIVPLLTLLPRLTGTGIWGGLVLAADTAVLAMLSPYAGTVVDRVDRRKLMVGADLVSAGAVLLLLLVRSSATAWIALVAIGFVAAAKAFFAPASAAALPNLVDRADLSRASVLSGSAWGSMLAIGAALGGAMDALLGPYWCFSIDAVSFGFSAWLTARTTKPFGEAREPAPRISMREDVRATMAYARGEPRVPALVLCKVGPGLGNGIISLFPLLAVVFGAGPLGTGLFFSVRGLGAVAGPLLMRRWVARDESGLWRALSISMVLFSLAYLGLSVTTSFAVALLLVFLGHVGAGSNWILSTYGLQAVVPDSLRGRVFSADFMVVTIAIAVSQIGTGVLSEFVAPRRLTAGLAIVALAYSVAWLLATRQVRGRRPTRGGQL